MFTERAGFVTKLRVVAAFLVVAAAAAVVAWREVARPNAPDSTAASAKPRVVLFADLSEEDEEAGCGAIIRAVREAATRGVVTKEIDARAPGDGAKKYRLLVAPAIIIFDTDGREQRRFEGETPDTVKAIGAELERVFPPKP